VVVGIAWTLCQALPRHWQQVQSFLNIGKRLRRAMQRWCVDACSAYGWAIPFPQRTLHGAVAQTPQG
jgi:hypothetical protein